MPQTNQIDQTLQINSSELPQNRKDNKNILILILVILIVGLLGILMGLLAFLLNSRNSNNDNQTSTIGSSSKTISTIGSRVTNIESSTNSSNSMSSSLDSTSDSSTTSSSSISFLHNEGKYIRFDYPSGWKLDVSSSRQDGTFTSFNDIDEVSISNGETALLVNGYGIGCMGAEDQYVINGSDTSILKETKYKTDVDNIATIDRVNDLKISNFEVRLLNLNSAKGYGLVKFIKENEKITKVVRYENNSYKFSDCMSDTIFFNNDIFGQARHLQVYPHLLKISLNDFGTIIERFTNSFEKK